MHKTEQTKNKFLPLYIALKIDQLQTGVKTAHGAPHKKINDNIEHIENQ